MPQKPTPINRRLFVLLIVLISLCTVGIWRHNRDIIRDLFDYSTVITAAGKVEAGFKPYTGVRSPMQSSVYLFNYATERFFGWNYLALTLGGLVQALGGAWLLAALLWRKLGAVEAALMVMAVTFAGLLQHVVFFYNPLGILCFSIVVLGLALEPRPVPWRSWRAALVLAALFVGGMNKLNFQGAALLLGGLITIAAWVDGRTTLGGVMRTVGLMVLFGLILPVGFELWWTGATFREWLENVVLMPTARQVSFAQLFDPNLYLRPIFDFHHHMLVRPIGGIGVLLMVASAIWLGWSARKHQRPWWDWLVRLALVFSGWVMGALLMLTNHESVLLTSLAFPVLGAALYLVYRSGEPGADQWMRRAVFGAALLWSVAGGYATWNGSRVLYTLNPPPRSDYVRVDDTTGPMAYFHGESDRDYFRTLLNDGKSRLVTNTGWQAWPNSIRRLLAEDYRAEQAGSRDLIYHPRGKEAPAPSVAGNDTVVMADFRAATGCNIMLSATRITPNFKLESEGGEAIFAARSDACWAWPLGANSFAGKAVARLDADATGAYAVTFRIMTGDPNTGQLLWETPVVLTPERRQVAIPFSLHAQGRSVWLETVFAANSGSAATAGWRDMRITYATELDQVPSLPFNRGLLPLPSSEFDGAQGSLWFGRDQNETAQDIWHRAPAENWRRYDQPVSNVAVTTEFEINPSDPGDPVVVTLAWYRAGRFEIMTERMIDLRQVDRLTLKAWFPEPTGWVGLLTRPAGGAGAGHRMKITQWEVH